MEKLMQMTESPAYVLADWREIIKEIDSEFKIAKSTDERVALLAMFKATMDIAETTIAPEDLEKFKDARLKHYKSHVLSECFVGKEICTETLFAVTEREISAGRMSAEDNLHQIAKTGMSAPHFTRAQLISMEQNAQAEINTASEKSKGFLAKILSRLKR